MEVRLQKCHFQRTAATPQGLTYSRRLTTLTRLADFAYQHLLTRMPGPPLHEPAAKADSLRSGSFLLPERLRQ